MTDIYPLLIRIIFGVARFRPESFFNLIRYRPIQDVRKISVPVLFIASKRDSLIPLESSRNRNQYCTYVQYHEWGYATF